MRAALGTSRYGHHTGSENIPQRSERTRQAMTTNAIMSSIRVGVVKKFLNRFDIKSNIRQDQCTGLLPLDVARLSKLN